MTKNTLKKSDPTTFWLISCTLEQFDVMSRTYSIYNTYYKTSLVYKSRLFKPILITLNKF